MIGTGLEGKESWEVPQPPLGTNWDSTASSANGASDAPLRAAVNRKKTTDEMLSV